MLKPKTEDLFNYTWTQKTLSGVYDSLADNIIPSFHLAYWRKTAAGKWYSTIVAFEHPTSYLNQKSTLFETLPFFNSIWTALQSSFDHIKYLFDIVLHTIIVTSVCIVASLWILGMLKAICFRQFGWRILLQPLIMVFDLLKWLLLRFEIIGNPREPRANFHLLPLENRFG